jgi:RNA polymerase sigma-70 factor (sigma-E family)
VRGSVRDTEFSQYVVGRRAQLRRTAYLLCGDSHRSEDLVQTTLMKVYVAWPRIRREGNVDAFSRRVMVNAHIDDTRRPWRRERVGVEEHDVPAAGATTAGEDRDLLLSALAGLPPRQRAAVVLRHYWGLSVQETAADLGCSTGTVKSQTSHALKRLEQALAPHYDERNRR